MLRVSVIGLKFYKWRRVKGRVIINWFLNGVKNEINIMNFSLMVRMLACYE